MSPAVPIRRWVSPVMKPARRRKPAPGTAEPADASPAALTLQVLIFANTGLPEQEFSAQTEKLRSVASYDGENRSWYTWISFDRPEQAAAVLATLFDAARVHGATIRVRALPAGEGSPSGQAAGPSGPDPPA